jgi:hypothetical protein
LIRYDDLVGDVGEIGAVVRDIALLDDRPMYAAEADYDDGEAESLARMMDLVEGERESLGENYSILFAEVRRRLAEGASRVQLRLATEVLLALATPRFAFFPLGFTIGPLLESEGRPREALAAYREALRVAPDPTTRLLIETKVNALTEP